MNKRIYAALSGNVLFQIINICIQVFTVPFFLDKWGVAYYGEWLLLYSVPSYIASSDLGLGTTVTTQLTILNGEKKYDELTRLLKTAFWIIIIFGSLIFLIFTFIFINSYEFLRLTKIKYNDFFVSSILLSIYSYLALFSTLPLGFYRVIKNYAFERYITSVFKLIETFVIIILLFYDYRVLPISLALLFVRIVYLSYIISDLHLRSSLFRLFPFLINISTIKNLFRPSLNMFFLQFGQMFMLQGIIMTIGVKLGSVNLVVFNTTKTLINVAKQAINIVNLSFWSEFSYAFGEKKFDMVKKNFNLIKVVNFGISFLIAILLIFTGNYIFKIWTLGNVELLNPFFELYLLTVIINSYWSSVVTMLGAVNCHNRLAFTYSLTTVIAFLFFVFIPFEYGLTSISISLICFEVILFLIAYFEKKRFYNYYKIDVK